LFSLIAVTEFNGETNITVDATLLLLAPERLKYDAPAADQMTAMNYLHWKYCDWY